jgi:dihydroorotase (homodimeric type)
VTDLRKIYPTLQAMQREGLVLLVHGEVTDQSIDLFDREAVFIEQQLKPLRKDFPELKIVMEHVTTKEAAEYVAAADDFLAATITPQHLLFNRNAIFLGGVRPHFYCLPVQARNPSPGAGAGRHQRQPQVLPGHGQRSSRRAPEGSRDRLRRLLQRPRRHRDVCRGV